MIENRQTELEILNLSKLYKQGKKKIIANSEITICAKAGEITAIVGTQGAGKTTLLNQIIGVTAPSEGSISFDTIELSKSQNKARELVSLMPQFPLDLRELKVKQAVKTIFEMRGGISQELSLVENLLRRLNLTDFENKFYEDIPTEIQQLTLFAMTVICPPPILLFDEPIINVTSTNRQLVWNYLRQLADEGHLVIITMKELSEAKNYCDKYILLNRGRVIKDERLNLESLRESVDDG